MSAGSVRPRAAAIDGVLRIEDDFPPVGYDAWRAKAEADLEGAPFEKKLVGRTADGIALEPLATAGDRPSAGDPAGFPGAPPLTRGMAPLGRTPGGWDVRQEVTEPDPAAAGAVVRGELREGATSVEVRLDAAARAGLDADAPAAAGLCGRGGVMVFTLDDLRLALEGVPFASAPVSLDAGAAYLPAAALLAALWEERGVAAADAAGAGAAAGADAAGGSAVPGAPGSCTPRGAFNADPLGALLRDGALPAPLGAALEQMADLAVWTAATLPRVTAVRVSTAVYHDAGSSTVQDLGFALATAVEYLRALTAAGLTLEAAAAQIVFHETVGCRFFQAIAKLRALRTLWARALEACGAGPGAAAGAGLVVETSRRVITQRAPWVNLLRDTAACFAGAVAGADAIITLPMDVALGPSDALSRRLARNTQVILRDECRLGAVVDPAGGSWSLEKLTAEMAEKAWDFFREVEGRGGMCAAATSGWVAERVAAMEQESECDVATRKAAITGVSAHPDVFEEGLARPAADHAALRAAAAARLAVRRRDRAAAEPAAALRDAAARGARGGDLMAAAVAAARAGATIGELTAALTGRSAAAAGRAQGRVVAAGGEQSGAVAATGGDPPDPAAGSAAHGARVTPLPVRPYAAAYEQLRDAADAYAEAHGGERPKVFLARLGAPVEYLARTTWAQDFFEAGGFEPASSDGDVEAQAAACAASGARIAVVCSSDARYATDVENVVPRLRAAGVRTVVLAGNPGDAEARYRAAGVDRFIFVTCDVLATLRDLLREEGVL